MDYTITIADPRQLAGIDKQLAAYNAGQADADKLSVQQYLASALPLQAWADTHAPASIPLGFWLARWTDAERDGAFTLGAQNAEIRALWIEMMKHPEVQPDNPELQAGVPLVCAALEQMGVIAPGQAATRAAAISAF